MKSELGRLKAVFLAIAVMLVPLAAAHAESSTTGDTSGIRLQAKPAETSTATGTTMDRIKARPNMDTRDWGCVDPGEEDEAGPNCWCDSIQSCGDLVESGKCLDDEVNTDGDDGWCLWDKGKIAEPEQRPIKTAGATSTGMAAASATSIKSKPTNDGTAKHSCFGATENGPAVCTCKGNDNCTKMVASGDCKKGTFTEWPEGGGGSCEWD